MNQPTFADIDIAVVANTIATIKAHPVYQEIVKEAFGGVMYNVANRNKYDDKEIKALWLSLPEANRDAQDGIIKGAFNFLLGDY